MNKKILFLLLIIHSLFLFAENLEFTKQSDTDQNIWLRIKYKNRLFKFTMIEHFNKLENQKNKFNFVSNKISFGTLSVEGILREINNPFGYDISSSVFYEITDFPADNSLAKSNKSILYFKPTNKLGIYQIQQEGYESSGIYLNYLKIKKIFASSSLIYSRGFKDEESDDWFMTFRNHKAGNLIHSANKLDYRGTVLDNKLAFTMSSGEFLKKAYLIRNFSSLTFCYMDLSYLKIKKDKNYINPDGSFEKYSELDSFYIKLLPEKKLNLNLKITEKYGPGLRPWDDDNYELKKLCEIIYEEKLWDLSFDFENNIKQENNYNKYSFEISRDISLWSFSFSYKRDEETDLLEIYKLIPRFNGKYINCYLIFTYNKSEKNTYSFASGFDLDLDEIKFYLRFKNKKDIDLEVFEKSFDLFEDNYLLTMGIKIYF